MKTMRVALLIETARGYGRDFLRGVVRYGRLHGPWSFYLTPGDFEQALPRMRQWSGTGIIARIETPRVARTVLQSGVPAIALDLSRKQLRPSSPLSQLSEVASDSHGAARMAAEYLLGLGFAHYAFVGRGDRIWSERREESFTARVREAGYAAHVFAEPRPPGDRSWAREQVALARFIESLPKPVGVMACDDLTGRSVLEACRMAGAGVPDDVAVIGVDNDELVCDLADPPLTSVVLNAEGGGFRAAELLERLMTGRVRKPRRLLVEPLRVVARRSTDVLAHDDPDVARAVRFIQDHAAWPIGIPDVVEHVKISRRALEIRFRAALGRTVHREIQRTRLDKARRLLQESDAPIPQVATASGFGSASYLSQVFRREVGLTPAKYRARVRDGSLNDRD